MAFLSCGRAHCPSASLAENRSRPRAFLLRGCIKTEKSPDFSVLKVFWSKFKELKVSYKAKMLDSSFSVSKTLDTPPK
ncbi:MAG: hypothetical protein BRD49_02045 [Bacteroidetes bacterium SW_10_40_5]|nr:MAG: hypothetical protein BRD49_02045 [Bacteroidetes bacterium SW_10_40_5]